MKIVFLIDSLGSGGAQRQVVTLSKIFKARDHDVSVLCYNYEDFFHNELKIHNIPVYWKIDINPFKRIFRIRRFIRKGDYDIVISFLDVPNFLNCFAAVGGRKWKVITSERSAKSETFKSRRGKLFGWFQRYADSIVCNSNNAKGIWLEFYPEYKDKLDVIYNPVVLPKITSKYTPKRNGKLNIVVAASYQYLKNPIGLIKALTLMTKTEKEQIKIDWYGRIEVETNNTKAYDHAAYLIADFKLENVIHLHEETKNIIEKMNLSDCVSLFSCVEGLPNTICEGMTIGKPIIMSKVSDYSVLVDCSNGFLCNWDNIESIRDALTYAINLNEEQLKEMGANSAEKAKNLFSTEIIIKQWIDLL